ncbi:MAG: putative outer membrane protein involved in nutrient binding [Chitinophagaceae bacterium]|nr:putative outer membrane protein involved in nutrient binding [Chitinophagaceae bacterium]
MKSKLLPLLILFLCSLSLLLFQSVSAQNRAVTGRVVNEKGDPVVGASVSVASAGRTRYTTTGSRGEFSLQGSPTDMFTISSIGYEVKKVLIGQQSEFNISLTSKTESLDEVVVVGYGVQNRRDVTGTISKIDGKVFASLPVSSFDAALQGRAAGVQVTQSTGMAGSGTIIRIRGTGSITAGGEPLYVVDGIPIPANSGQTIAAANTNPLSSINPADIESIEILKDASSAAIYGSRGANGVVLITTKRGKKGKPQFSFSSRYSASNITRKPELLNTEEFIALYKEAVANDYKFNPTGAPATKVLPGGYTEADALKNNTDWQDATTHTGFSTFNDLSVSLGSQKLRAYVGLSQARESSFLVNDIFRRYSGRVNIDYMPFSFLKVSGNFSYTATDQNHVPVGFDGGYGRAISTALPYFPIYQADTFYRTPIGSNSLAEVYNRTRRSKNGRTFAGLNADLTIIKGLALHLEGTFDYSDNKLYQLTTKVLSNTPPSNVNNSFLANVSSKAFLNYNLQLKQVHRFKFLLGGEILKYTTNSKSESVTFLPGAEDWLFNNPVLPPDSIPSPTNPAINIGNPSHTRSTGTQTQYSFLSYYGRVNYTFKDRYLFTGIFRRDGSSRFGTNNKFGTFPAVSVGWIVTSEQFMKNIKGLSYLKLKAGYGITGNAEIGNYAQWGTTNTATSQQYVGNAYYSISGLANPDLKWETTKNYDIGLEYGFLNNRISGEISYYIKDASDLFLNVRTTTSAGYGSVLGNYGKVRNKGIEFSISSKNIVRKNFTWTTDFNIARNTNRVLDIGTTSPDALGGNGDTRVLTGYPIGSNYLVKTLYIDPVDGMPVYEMLDAAKNVAGTTKEYNAQRDRQIVGSPYPDFFGGIDNRFTWKNFEFGFTGTYQIGGNIYDDAEKFQLNNIGEWNPKKEVLQRWQKPGDITTIPRLTLGLTSLARTRNTTEYLHSASYFRMKVVSFGYRLPQQLIKKLHISNARIALSASNIFTISEYKGDPEVFRDATSSQQRNVSPNVTYLTPPQSKNYTLSLNLNF